MSTIRPVLLSGLILLALVIAPLHAAEMNQRQGLGLSTVVEKTS